MKILVHVSRILVAITFIFSGFVKLVDPIGSAYKFQEYFSPDVLNLEFLMPYALPFAVLLILIELMLGVMLLIGCLPKTTMWGLLGMILIFLFLTWYSAYYNKVTDCGCFGDAITLSTWGTFYKNVVLVVLIIFLLKNVKQITPIFSLNGLKWIVFFTFSGSLFIVYYVLIHLPIIDFRPYAVGENIREGMEYKGEEMPLIHDFFLENNDGEELTNEVLNEDKVMLVVMYDLNKSNLRGFEKVKKITDKALEKGYKVFALSASLNETYLDLKQQYNFNFDMLFCDETTLKTIIRANPGILTLQKGTITGKWSWIDSDEIILE
ncbi:BT_3928 family protein [Lutibacter sp.]